MSGSTVENRRKPSSTGKTCGFNICVYVCVCVCMRACVRVFDSNIKATV